MGWLQRIFGMEKPEGAQVNPAPAPAPVPATVPADAGGGEAPAQNTIPPERIGLNGEYDQSGLAKRVVLAFDQDPRFEAVHRVWVAQLGTTVVLTGEAPSQDILAQMIEVARGVNGATDVKSDEVKIVSA